MDTGLRTSTPPLRGRSGSLVRRWRLWCARLCVGLVVGLAVPGTADLVRDVVALLAGAECCDGPCEEDSGRGCAGTCLHCSCCVHPSAVLLGALRVPALLFGEALTFSSRFEAVLAAGYRAPPFRPPVG